MAKPVVMRSTVPNRIGCRLKVRRAWWWIRGKENDAIYRLNATYKIDDKKLV